MTRWKAEKKVPRASRQVLVFMKDCEDLPELYTPKREAGLRGTLDIRTTGEVALVKESARAEISIVQGPEDTLRPALATEPLLEQWW